jgi:hypothetical protein
LFKQEVFYLYIYLLRLRREYTGEWVNDKKEGKGAFFYQAGDRYDG